MIVWTITSDHETLGKFVVVWSHFWIYTFSWCLVENLDVQHGSCSFEEMGGSLLHTSMICSSESSLMMFSSTPTSPNSFSMMANFMPWSGDVNTWFNNVVLPEPRKPVSTVTGTFFAIEHKGQRPKWNHETTTTISQAKLEPQSKWQCLSEHFQLCLFSSMFSQRSKQVTQPCRLACACALRWRNSAPSSWAGAACSVWVSKLSIRSSSESQWAGSHLSDIPLVRVRNTKSCCKDLKSLNEHQV